ncbi:Snf7-domain-containing protein [Crepidotus variabilis]|uniref:Vacuolar-sorting protein SNF7 n=1 Tax=Crepidotus variabilis TaxID=179855 RepID=A0A9P6ETH2_9AGAR|nr:Snf7-domain-containing protein [Crepidotus variabilis]
MMASFMSYFGGGRKDPKQSAREAIIQLREQLQLIDKKEEHLQKKVDDELKKAKANAVSNKAVATAALKRKNVAQQELDRLGGTRMQLETQVNTLESANLNAEIMRVVKNASTALGQIHGKMTIDKVDSTMAALNEQHEIAREIAEAISAPPLNADLDDDVLKLELQELQEEVLNERLAAADHPPLHEPPSTSKLPAARTPAAAEDDEERELRELQAELAAM